VRDSGWSSTVSRGKRRRPQGEEPTTAETFGEVSSSAAKRGWERMIKQIYEGDPLARSRCAGAMRKITFIEHPEVIATILTHLDLWPVSAHRPPPTRCTPSPFTIPMFGRVYNYLTDKFPLAPTSAL